MAKLLILAGFILIGAGVLWHFGLLKWVGSLPGDIRIEREGFKFYFPIATCIIFSLAITLFLKLGEWFQK